jgi:hypothetical protein
MPMTTRTIAPVSLLVAALSACRTPLPLARHDSAQLIPLFGPVIGSEVIRGREENGDHVILLAGESTMVRVDLLRRQSTRVAIGVAPGEACWGLARLQDGSLWTLKARNAVIRVEEDGRVSQVVPLSEPHVGLFGSGDRLIYQRAISTPPGAALRAGPPGAADAVWSGMTTRLFSRIGRPQMAALNMVACGGSARAERPCWFPDEPAVSLIAPDGDTRRISLAGLAVVAPEVLLAAENPARPVRDAYLDRRGRLWVLSSGVAPPGAAEVPGGWILARYGLDGTADGHVRLAAAARLILRAEDGRALVLAGSGHVSEVTPW